MHNPNTLTRIQVLELMALQGGSFVRKLAQAWMLADEENHSKLMLVYGGTYARYAAQVDAKAQS